MDPSGRPSWVIVCMQSATAHADRGEGLVQVRRHVGEFLALFRLGREAEGDPRLGDRLLRLGEGGCRDPQLLLTQVVVLHG